MSNFQTKVDFSTQIKEYPNTDGTLSGSVNVQQYTILGTDYSGLPLGLDPTTTGISATYVYTTMGYFTGTTGSTTYYFTDSNMDIANPYLSTLNGTNSGLTQNVAAFSPTYSTTIDGNYFDVIYSGVSFDMTPVTFIEYTSGEFSGVTFTNVLNYLSGTTYPWWFLKSGSTTWGEVKGRLQTDRMTIIEGAFPGYVLTADNLNGDAIWQPVSGLTWAITACTSPLFVSNIVSCPTSADTLTIYSDTLALYSSLQFLLPFSGGNGTDSILVVDGNGYVKTIPQFSGGSGTCITDLYVSNIHSCSPLNINPLDEGNIYFGSTSGLTYDVTNKRLGLNQSNPKWTFDFFSYDNRSNFFYYDDLTTFGPTFADVQQVILSGTSNLNVIIGTLVDGNVSTQMGVRGSTNTGTFGDNVGKVGDGYLSTSAYANGLNILNFPSVSSNKEDYIRFYAGNYATAVSDIHIQGSGTTRGFVGIGTETPTVKLHVNGETIVNANKMMLSDSLTTIPSVGSFEGIFSVHDSLGLQGFLSSNTNPSGITGTRMYNDLSVDGLLAVGGSQTNRLLTPVTGNDFYRNKILLRGGTTSEGMVFNATSSDPSSTFWWEFNGASGMVLKGDGSTTGAYLGLSLNPDGTEMPTSSLQIGGTGTTGTFQYKDGNQQSGYVLTSDSDGNATWQVSTGGGSGTTIANTFFTDDITTSGNTDTNGYRILYPFTATTSGDYIFDATTLVGLGGIYTTADITTTTVLNGTPVGPPYKTSFLDAIMSGELTHSEKKKLTLTIGDVFHYGVIDVASPATANVISGAMIIHKIS